MDKQHRKSQEQRYFASGGDPIRGLEPFQLPQLISTQPVSDKDGDSWSLRVILESLEPKSFGKSLLVRYRLIGDLKLESRHLADLGLSWGRLRQLNLVPAWIKGCIEEPVTMTIDDASLDRIHDQVTQRAIQWLSTISAKTAKNELIRSNIRTQNVSRFALRNS